MERTEEERILKGPITVTLGGKEYQIDLLCIRDARVWRKQLAGLVAKLPTFAKMTTDNAQGFEAAVTGMLCVLPDATADLFFAYAKGLDREVIEAVATELEIGKAIETIMAVACPLLRSLTGAMGKLSQ